MAETERKTLDDIALVRDRNTLGILIKRIKELKEEKEAAEKQLEQLVPQAALLMAGHEIKTLLFQGKDFTVVDGKNVSYSQERLAKAMLKYQIKADVIAKILDTEENGGAKKITPYTTISMTAPKGAEVKV